MERGREALNQLIPLVYDDLRRSRRQLSAAQAQQERHPLDCIPRPGLESKFLALSDPSRSQLERVSASSVRPRGRRSQMACTLVHIIWFCATLAGETPLLAGLYRQCVSRY